MSADPIPQELPKRYPALRHIGETLRRRRIPFVRQLHGTECGAACLAMVLGYHGKEVRLDQIRDLTGIGRDGASALALTKAARMLGLRGRGVRVEPEDLPFLPAGAILHWEFNHFVVFERMARGGIDIVDPATGRRHISTEHVRKAFTGVALVFEPSEAFEPGKTGGRPVWRQLAKVLKASRDWLRILTVSMMLQVFALALPLLTGAVVDRVVPRSDVHLLAVIGVGLVTIIVFEFLASMIRGHLLLNLRTKLDTGMTVGFLDHLLQLPYAFFLRRPAGDLLMRLNSNATIREILASGVMSGVLDGLLVLVYLLLLVAVYWPMALLTLLLGGAQVAILVLSRRAQRDLLSKSLQVQATQESYVVEMLAGIETLKAMGAERRAGEHWSGLFVDEMNVNLERGRLNTLVESLHSMFKLASPLVLLLYGATLVLHGGMSLGTMLAVTALANAFLQPLSNLVGSASQLQLLSSYVDRIEDVLTARLEQEPKPRPAPQLRGRITLDRVSFQYDGGGQTVIRDLSLDIAPGSFVAIVGPSGSSKSTLASLLLGLHQPTSGRVLYDGHDLAELDLPGVRQQLGIVTQRSYLFGTTLRANIALSDPTLPLHAIEDAARRACIHEEIARMPMGYDTLLLDGGASLSGGQRQRVCLARALVQSPAILLLDEATSALDAITERKVQHQLGLLPCTRIVIAHRLSTIRDADLILVMDEGRIVEQGRHAELLARRGRYADLLGSQVG